MIYMRSYEEEHPVGDALTVRVRWVVTSREDLAELRGALFDLGRSEGWQGVPGEATNR